MVQRNRQTLKNSFSNGKKPSEKDFENLIDSTLNILDDGFYKTPEAGVQLAPALGEKRVVVSLFSQAEDPEPVWELSVTLSGELKISRYREENPNPLLTLSPEGVVRIGTEGGNTELLGRVSMENRQHSFSVGSVPADGKWYAVTPLLEGSGALEIVVACGKRESGKHAILMALATYSYGNYSRVRTIESRRGGWGNQLLLRWKRSGHTVRLQARSRFSYGKEVLIRYQINSLWNDPLTEE